MATSWRLFNKFVGNIQLNEIHINLYNFTMLSFSGDIFSRHVIIEIWMKNKIESQNRNGVSKPNPYCKKWKRITSFLLLLDVSVAHSNDFFFLVFSLKCKYAFSVLFLCKKNKSNWKLVKIYGRKLQCQKNLIYYMCFFFFSLSISLSLSLS